MAQLMVEQNILKIELLKTANLIPYINNSRTHSEEQVNQIAASIQEFGFNNPILIDADNGVIAGHGRIMAAKKLGIDELPCVRLEHLSEAQKKAYIIADNKLALNADWNFELLKMEIENLQELDFDIDLLGFDEDELSEFETTIDTEDGLTDDEETPEPPDEPVSMLGDVWVLGKHRLMCGDSTNIDAVETLMGNGSADMIFTDPPYGMSYGGGREPGSSKKGATVKAHGMIKNDDLRGDDLIQLIRDAVASAIAVSKQGGACYVCFPWRTYAEFEAALMQIGLNITACIVWDKKSIGLGFSNYRPQHEFIFYAAGDAWHGDNSQSDVWSMSRGNTGAYVHPTQKPVELIEKALINSSKTGDVIIDVFGGSGSTLIACEKAQREARLMELDPKYVDVIISRWEDYTGKQAIHETSGKTYQELKNEQNNRS